MNIAVMSASGPKQTWASALKMSAFRVKRTLLEDGPQVLELVKKVPDVVASALLTVRMKVGQFWIIAIAVERFLRGPLDKDHHCVA
jgi:hypothetical protein